MMSDEKRPEAAAPSAPSPTTALAPRRGALAVMAERFSLEPSMLLNTLRATIMRPGKDGHQATNEEIAAFIAVANEHGLNPFTREIHAFLDPHRGVVPIVGIDGWLKLVNQHPQFAGMELIEQIEEGRLVGVTCRMFRRDRERATEVTEYLEECRRDTEPWRRWPRRMLRHKATIQAARYAFGFAGIYDDDEGERIVAAEATVRDSAPLASMPTKPATARLAEKLVVTPPVQSQSQAVGAPAGAVAEPSPARAAAPGAPAATPTATTEPAEAIDEALPFGEAEGPGLGPEVAPRRRGRPRKAEATSAAAPVPTAAPAATSVTVADGGFRL